MVALFVGTMGGIVVEHNRDIRRMRNEWSLVLVAISIVLQVLMAVPFSFLSLVVQIYAPAVAWIALGCSIAVLIIAIILWTFFSFGKGRSLYGLVKGH